MNSGEHRALAARTAADLDAACAARHSQLQAAVAKLELDVKHGDVKTLDAAIQALKDEKIKELEEERDALRADATHWKRYVVMAVVGLLTGGFLLYLGRLLGK